MSNINYNSIVDKYATKVYADTSKTEYQGLMCWCYFFGPAQLKDFINEIEKLHEEEVINNKIGRAHV